MKLRPVLLVILLLAAFYYVTTHVAPTGALAPLARLPVRAITRWRDYPLVELPPPSP